MSKTGTIARGDARDRELNALEAQRPELSAWLRPLRVSLASLDDDTWRSVIPICSHHRAVDAPLLHGAIVSVPREPFESHVRTVMQAALTSRDLDSLIGTNELELLCGAVNRDLPAVDSPAINAALDLAAIPLFIACTRTVNAAVTQWAYGYCPVCGELPLFSEVLGLERSRQLRCCRCSMAWKTNVLVCPFCGETDHARLGSLVPDGPAGQICWLETCSTCKGYIKARAALRPMGPESVLIEDARTIDLDLVATGRGYEKPSSGHLAHVRLQLE